MVVFEAIKGIKTLDKIASKSLRNVRSWPAIEAGKNLIILPELLKDKNTREGKINLGCMWQDRRS